MDTRGGLIIPQIPLLRHGQFPDSFQMDSAAEIRECMEKRIKKISLDSDDLR